MTFVTAALVACAVAGAVGSMLVGRPVRRPAPEPTASTHVSGRRPLRWAIPNVRRPSQMVRPASLGAWADDLARALRHGSTLHTALANTLPTDTVIERRSASLRHWLGRGATVAEACDEWADELAGHADALTGRRRRAGDRTELLGTMAAVLAAIASLGGAAAAPLDRFAVTMRQRASDDLERAAHSAQAKMSAKVLTSVPLAVLALLVLTDADVREVITSTAGGSTVALGLALNTLGALWMRRIAGTGEEVTPC